MELPSDPLRHPRTPAAAHQGSTSNTHTAHHHQPAPAASPSRSLHSPVSPSNGHSPSALARHQLTRSLSPDLPTRDALYLFCNFSSYMRSPQEGAEGIKDNTDFHDTIRLLDFARVSDPARPWLTRQSISGNPHANVHVLHLKYRFQTPDQGLPTTRQEKLSALGYGDDRGIRQVTVPQPFSTLHDPVIKVDYQDNGVFHPLPAQAVFQHISKACQPPPRIIVVSYVGAKATENHVSSLAAWAHTSTPPIYVFSPLETRLRERRTLSDALHHAIPISMYAWPVGASQTPSPTACVTIASPHRTRSQDDSSATPNSHRYQTSPRRASMDSRTLSSPNAASGTREYSPRTYPSDPVATLSIITDAHRLPSLSDPDVAGDRVPLWMLAPGAGVLHGSTSVSLGVKLSDFSAINLMTSLENGDKGLTPQNQTIDSRVLGIRVSSADKRSLGRVPKVSLPPLEPHARRSNAATPEPISRTGSAASVRISHTNGGAGPKVEHVNTGHPLLPQGNGVNGHPTIHLTPPDQDPRRLSPPDRKPAEALPPSQQSWPKTRSWPTTREKVPGWKRGRREVMEDALEEIGREADVDPAGNLSFRLDGLILDAQRTAEGSGISSMDDIVRQALQGGQS